MNCTDLRPCALCRTFPPPLTDLSKARVFVRRRQLVVGIVRTSGGNSWFLPEAEPVAAETPLFSRLAIIFNRPGRREGYFGTFTEVA